MMHETMFQHSIGSAAVAAFIVAVVWFVAFLSKRRRQAQEDAVLETAAERMRDASIVVSLLPTAPEQLRRVQEELKDRHLYNGTADGTLDAETVTSLRALAKAENVNMDEEVQRLLTASGDFPPCPNAQRESRAVQTAVERLAESNAPLTYYSDRRDRIA